jgi:predicted DNA-binding protein
MDTNKRLKFDKAVHLLMPSELVDRIDSLSKSQLMNRAQWIRHVISYWLDACEQDAITLEQAREQKLRYADGKPV